MHCFRGAQSFDGGDLFAVVHQRQIRHESTRRPCTCTVQAPHCPWSQPFFVPVSDTVSRMQSNSVVRGSMFSLWSLPLMRSVIGTAPSMRGPALVEAASVPPAALFADAGTYAATRLAATLLPEAKRNLRRVGPG